MQLQDLMSGTFTVAGHGTFEAGNVYKQTMVTLSCVDAEFKLVIDDVVHDLTEVKANFDFDLAGSTITRLNIRLNCNLEYGDFTSFHGTFN